MALDYSREAFGAEPDPVAKMQNPREGFDLSGSIALGALQSNLGDYVL
jgi:hypothetical protein